MADNYKTALRGDKKDNQQNDHRQETRASKRELVLPVLICRSLPFHTINLYFVFLLMKGLILSCFSY